MGGSNNANASKKLTLVRYDAMKVEMETDLAGSQNDGGQLGAVPPLCQEGEGERLEEDGRDQAVPLGLWHRSS